MPRTTGFYDEDPTLTATWTLDGHDDPAYFDAPPIESPLPGRYVDLGFLGSGAMGEVRKARDVVLGNVVAVKVLRRDAGTVTAMRERFEAEARLTARLRHPNIVAVHHTGVLDDGRVWFSMELVDGRTLAEVIGEVHDARGPQTWRTSRNGWSLRGLVRALIEVCDAVGLAHSRGVIHRDLKPLNVMVGEHGEIKVMDWGIAKGLGMDLGGDPNALTAIPSAHRTAVGKVIGTPAYMAPEQAWGRRDQMGPWSDVYALGALLYQVLTGHAPYDASPESTLDQVRRGPPPHPEQAIRQPAPPLPPGLVEVCLRAMAREPEQRFADASVLGEALRHWLEKDERSAQADILMRRALEILPELNRLRSAAEALEQSARITLASLPVIAPLEAKMAGWQLEDYARANRIDAARRQAEVEEMLWAVLSIDPDHKAARQQLLLLQRQALETAEREGDGDEAALREVWLRELDVDGLHAEWLLGVGAVSLDTSPTGARVVLYRFEEMDLVRTPVLERELGQTPLHAVPLPAGEWLLELHAEGHDVVRYPIYLRRGEHWKAEPPGAPGPEPVELPATGRLGPDDIYVPAGWAWIGGRQGVDGWPRRRVWVDAFVIDRTPVTLAEVLAFLVDIGPEAAAPFLSGYYSVRATSEPNSAVVVEGDGNLALAPGHAPDMVANLPGRSFVTAYLAWRAQRRGTACRLPTCAEWEKAVRGPSGRPYPWGARLDPCLAFVAGSMKDPVAVPVGTFTADRSVYGVLDGLGGGDELTCTPWSEDAPPDGTRIPQPAGPLPAADAVVKGVDARDGHAWAHLATRRRATLGSESQRLIVRGVTPWTGSGS